MNKTNVISGLPHLLSGLWRHISGRRQGQFILLTGFTLVSTFLDVVSLGAVLPFLGVLVAPDRIFKQPFIMDLARVLGVTSAGQLVLPLTAAFATVALIAGAVRMLQLWFSTRLAYAVGSEISFEVYRRTLYQPYQVHVARNSSEVISGITYKAEGAAYIMFQFLNLTSSAMSMIAIMLVLIAIDPVVALVSAVGFGASYGLISLVYRWRLRQNSQRIASEQTRVVKALQEGLGGIRDVLLDGTQPVYCDIYRQADQPLRRAQGNNTFLSHSPRPAMEAVGIVMIAALAYALSRQDGGMVAALPVLGSLALGAQRLLPAMHQTFSAWAGIEGNYAPLSDVLKLLDQPMPEDALMPDPAPLRFNDAIRFDAIRFRYSSASPWVLDGLNLTIPKGARVGFIGSTGSGKSTALDLLMGLLVPTEGELQVDGQPIIGNRVKAWQRTIAHVPQSIYLADATLAENIAFGVPREAMDFEQVKRAARQARIADFIESRPEGYNALVGERGIRLSGGQRQRICIARALYKRATVLIFDEATSALDNLTEQAVMETVKGLGHDLTIIIVAHRLTSLQLCNIIVKVEGGRVVAQGSYEQMINAFGIETLGKMEA